MSRILPWAVSLAVAAGCVTPRAFPPPDLPPDARLLGVAEPPTGGDAEVVPASASYDASRPQRPHDVLVLTGGGMYGAYSAGVLKGWTAAGTRPTFDVVTGVSTGSLIAVYAFLGSDWDDHLEAAYTTVGASDIYVRRYLVTAVLSDALADSTPLQRRIEREVTPELLDLVAAAHRDGRRLYVGTTNLDAKRFVVWDMGAIAAGSNPDRLRLFREVILASCSVPGLLPPVPIDVEIDGTRHTELHVDGGVTASAFLRPDMLGPATSPGGGPTDARVHVIVAGRLREPAVPVKRRLLDVSGESLRAAFQARWEGDLLRISVAARDRGAAVRIAAVGDGCGVDADAMACQKSSMRKLFEHGIAAASDGSAWRPLTPDLLAEDVDPPRAGIRFEIDRVSSDEGPIRRPALR